MNSVESQTSFYLQVLNATVSSKSEEYATLATDNFELTLHQIPEQYQEVIHTPPQIREDCAWKPTFDIADLHAARETANQLGGMLKDTSFEWSLDGFIYCDGNDPEGNVIQFRQRILAN
ncbi:MAG: hypothetical protein KGQ38_04025 [Actinomycetales bacterium]|nr:hypothetical protein [Actinomycetales bacterium]